MSNILAVFDIGPPLDAFGNPQKIGDIKYTDGATRRVCVFLYPSSKSADFYSHHDSRPVPFECTILPRNANCAALIRDLEVEDDI